MKLEPTAFYNICPDCVTTFRTECGERPVPLVLELPVPAWTPTEILKLVGVVSVWTTIFLAPIGKGKRKNSIRRHDSV
jgi:hypothetical protein